MKLRAPLLTAVIGLTLGACTTARESAHTTTTASPSTTSTTIATTSTTAIVGGQIGPPQSGVNVDGQPLSLTLSQFIDPAKDEGGYTTDSQGVAPQNDDHFATVELQITNRGNATISSSVLSVVGYDENGRAYSSVSHDANVSNQAYENFPCTTGSNLDGNASLSSLSPDESSTYCLGFILPDADTMSKIEVSGIVGSGTGYNTWAITDGFSGWPS